MTISECAFEGKVLSCYPPITQLKPSVNPLQTLPWASLLQAEQTHLTAFPGTLGAPALWTSWRHCPGFAPMCHCLSCAGEPKNNTQHSRCDLRSAELRGIIEAMPGGFSSGEKGMLLKTPWMNTENKRIVSTTLLNQKPRKRCSIQKSLNLTATVVLSSCNIDVSSKPCEAQNFCYPVFLVSTKEGMSFSKSWKTATGDCEHVSCSLRDWEEEYVEAEFLIQGVAFGLLVSWIKLAAALLKHWLWNVWAASFSGITARPLVGLFVLLHGLTGFPPKLLDYHASAVFTVLTVGLIWQRYRAWNLSLNALGFGCCSRSVAFDTVSSQCAQEELCCNSRRAVHSWATFCLCQVYPAVVLQTVHV